MTEDTSTRTNGYLIFLFVAGPIIAAVGFIAAPIAQSNAEQAANVSALTDTMEGGSGLGFEPDLGAFWAWIIVGIVGVVLLLAAIIVKAAQPAGVNTVTPARGKREPGDERPQWIIDGTERPKN